MSVNNRPLRAAIYARISLGTEESVSLDTQLADTRALAESKGWQVVRVITDETVSAFKKAPWQRPGLGAWLSNPDADVLIGWKVDRLIRRLSDLWKLHSVLTDKDVSLVTVVDRLDMTDTMGQVYASMLAGQAQRESENTSLRQTAARARQIDAGRVVGGKRAWPLQVVPNPNGPGKVWRPIPARARALRDAAAELTAKRTSLLAVCRAWNADPELQPNRRRVLNPDAPKDQQVSEPIPWRVTPLRNLLTNPTIAGATIRNGQPVRNADGTIRIDPERAILSWSEFEALGKALERWSQARQQRGERALLTGTLHCAGCNKPMSPNRSRQAYPQYKCSNAEVCRAQASVNMAAADKYMSELYLTEHGDRDVLVAREQQADSADVAALREAIAAISADMGVITGGDDEEAWDRLPSLRKQRAELQQRLDDASQRRPVVLVKSGETYAQRWERASVAERAELLRAAYHVTVRQAGQGKRFSPDNLTVRAWDEVTADPNYTGAERETHS